MSTKLKKNISKQFNEKINILKKHNKLYYSDDKPEISDADYDKIKIEILELIKKHDFLEKSSKEKNIFGAPPSNKFKKVKHLVPMLSLSNAFDRSDMVDFLKKVNNFLKSENEKIELFSEPKIDGISST